MSQTAKALKISTFKEFFKRLYSEYKYHKTFKNVFHKLNLILHKLKRVESEQKESYQEIASINYESQEEYLEMQSKKNKNQTTVKNLKSPLSTIVEQSDQNPSDPEDSKNIESLINDISNLSEGILPNENKIINQYKLELKNLAMEIQEIENSQNYELEKKPKSENSEFFKKLYEKENIKLTKLSKRFESLQEEFESSQDFINILKNEKEKLLKELDKEKKNTFRLQMKKDQDLKDKDKIKNNDQDQKLLEKENYILELQKQLKTLQTSLTKSRSDMALSNETKNSLENEVKILKNVKELLEKDNEKLNKLMEKKEKYIKEILIKAENPHFTSHKIQNLEENNESLKAELKKAHFESEELKAQVLDLQFVNKNLFKHEEILDLKHRIDQLEYQLLLKEEEIERIKTTSLEKIDNLSYLLETDKKRIRELEESMLKLLKDNKSKEEEITELKQILENYSDLGKDLKGIKKKLFS